MLSDSDDFAMLVWFTADRARSWKGEQHRWRRNFDVERCEDADAGGLVEWPG